MLHVSLALKDEASIQTEFDTVLILHCGRTRSSAGSYFAAHDPISRVSAVIEVSHLSLRDRGISVKFTVFTWRCFTLQKKFQAHIFPAEVKRHCTCLDTSSAKIEKGLRYRILMRLLKSWTHQRSSEYPSSKLAPAQHSDVSKPQSILILAVEPSEAAHTTTIAVTFAQGSSTESC